MGTDTFLKWIHRNATEIHKMPALIKKTVLIIHTSSNMAVFALLLWVGVELTGNVLINGWNKLGQDPPEGAKRIYCFLLRGQI